MTTGASSPSSPTCGGTSRGTALADVARTFGIPRSSRVRCAYCPAMRVPRRIALGAAALVALTVALPTLVSAATVDDLVALASNANVYGMSCRQRATDWDCTRAGNNLTPAWEAV